MNKGKSNSAAATPTTNASKASDLFSAHSLEESAGNARDDEDGHSDEDVSEIVE